MVRRRRRRRRRRRKNSTWKGCNAIQSKAP